MEKQKLSNDFEISTIQEENDWKELDSLKTLFCNTTLECEEYERGTFWYQRKYEDSIYKNRLRLAENFLRKYPKSSHYLDVLKFYFNFLFEPRFLKEDINNSRKAILDQKPIIINGDRTYFYQQLRSMPFDIQARENWIKKGDSLANEFLRSDATIDEKAMIEVAVLGRDLRRAVVLHEFLDLDKRKDESEYWQLFDRYFWKEILDRMELLIFKYPDYKTWPRLIDQFISVITKDYLSPELKIPYWEHFRDITNKKDLLHKYKVMEKINIKAKENIKALENLGSFDKTKPLEMEFISLEGKKISLKDLRGKVVLIDFWSIRCAPCIKEMPHLRNLYDKYKDMGFEVIGVVAEGDSEKKRVLKIINENGANWPQLLDKGLNVKVSYHSLFKIGALPTVWLLDKKGIIVDQNARGARLEPLIRKYLELND
ncbi:TlpA disulfide reductase family protein [Yeosuana marina]|uniref:TlpA family protein disulfide reductase n=1 Tax=Yeosuana marina TaxID=1565536 RepID=UPI0030C7DA09